MSDERDRFAESDEPEQKPEDVEAHRFMANDEGGEQGDEPDVEAHRNAAPRHDVP